MTKMGSHRVFSQIFILLVLIVLIARFSEASFKLNLRPKDIKIENVQNCISHPDSPIIIERFEIYQPARKQVTVNATMRVLKVINNNLWFKMYVSKCSSRSHTQCEEFDTIAIPNVCKRVTDRNALWTPVFDSVTPPLSCPIPEGVYNVRNGEFDLSIISRIPINPDVLNVNLTLFDYVTEPNNEKKKIKRQLACIEAKLIITLSKTSPPSSRMPSTLAKPRQIK